MALAFLLVNEQAILAEPQPLFVQQLQDLIATSKLLKKQVRQIASAPVPEVLRVLKLLATLFYGLPQPRQSLLHLYQGIAIAFSETTVDDHANSLGLAVIMMRAYLELTAGEIFTIRKTLQTSKSYDSEKLNVDARMFSLAMVNLSAAEMHVGKYYRAFKHAYRALEVFTEQFHKDKWKSRWKASTDDIVLEINIHYLLFQSLDGILTSESLENGLRNDYLQFLQKYYWEGFELCQVYLGEESRFTKLFMKYMPKSIQSLPSPRRRRPLPVITNSNDTGIDRAGMIKSILNSIEERINPRFDEIRQMIQDYNPGSEDVHVEPKFDLNKEKILAELTQNRQGETQVVLKLLASNNKKRFGRLHITVHVRSRLVCEEMIDEEVLQLLLSQVCSDDVKPLGVDLSNCTPMQLLRFYVMPFVGLDGSRLSVYPKPMNLISDKKTKFLDVECFVFVNYVSDAIMRLCLAPLDECYSLRIDLEMPQELALTFLSDSYFQSSITPDIHNMYMQATGEEFKQRQPQISLTVEEPKLHNSRIFQKELQSILDRLPGFIIDHKLAEGANKKPLNIFTINEVYIKVCLLEIGKTVLYGVKNMPWLKTIDTIVENTYSTYGPEGLIKARGYSSYEYSRLQKELGLVNLTSLKPCVQREVLALLSCRCTLEVFEQPMKESQIKRYGENCVKEVNFEKKVFVRNFILEDYTIPVTICVISLNLEVPIGVKITAYDVEQLAETSIFVRLQPDLWIRPQTDKAKATEAKSSIDKIAVVTSKEEFKTNYAVVPVLQGGGFSVLSKLIRCERNSDGSLVLSHVDIPDIRWCRLEDILTWQTFRN